jgi:hypothetical protein
VVSSPVQRITLLCILLCITHPLRPGPFLDSLSPLLSSIKIPCTKKNSAMTAFGIFILGSWRLFQKKAPKQLNQHAWTDLLKVWNVTNGAYWSAFDEKIIGTLSKDRNITMVKYNGETNSVEIRVERESMQKATGLFGYYIYKCMIKPFKGIFSQLKPLQDFASLADKCIHSSYLA